MNNLFKKVVSSVALVAMLAALIPTASFAATISDGDLVKAAGSSAIYLIQDGKKRVFPHSSVYLSWGYPANYSTVKTVTAEELAAYAEGDAVIYRDGFMFRFKGVGMTGGFDPSAVFFVSDGKVRPIESASAYMKLFNGGVNESSAWDRVYWIPDDLLAKFTYPQGSNITSAQIDAGQLPNGLVVRDSNSLYYVVNGGLLSNVSSTGLSANRYTANSNVFSKMLVTKLANSVLNLMPAGAAVTTADTSLLTVKKLTVTPSATNVILSSDKTSVEADGASYATLTATVPSTVTSVSFTITSGAGTLSASTVTPVAGVATVRITPAASSVSGTLTVSASATGLTSASVTVTTVANTLAPQVVSVSNQGMRLINVVFDKAVDKTTAESTGNYDLRNNKSGSNNPYNAKLLADGKTVQLFLNSGVFYNDSTEDSIEIKNIQNVAQTATMSTITKLMTVTDTSVPTVVAVEALGSKAIRVTFSEPVRFNNNSAYSKISGYGYGEFRLDSNEIDNGAAAAPTATNKIDGVTVTYPDAGDYTKALITFANPISVGAHTLTVSYNGKLTDYNSTTSSTDANNSYVMQPAGYVATVVSDTSVPTLSSVEVLSQTKVRYTFSKPISTPSRNAFFYSTSSTATDGSSPLSDSKIVKVSDTVYEVSWESAISAGTVYFYAGKTGYPVTDYSGNNISPFPSSKVATVSSDTAPTVSSVSMRTNSDRIVDVYFNKDVETSSATTASNYVFKKNGVVLTSTTGGLGIGSNGNPNVSIIKYVDGSNTNDKRIVIKLGEDSEDNKALPGGTYELCITNVKAISGSSSSAMTTSCSSFVVTDKTRPTLATTVNSFVDGTNISAATHRIVLKFSEALDATSATDGKSYKAYGFTGYTSWTKLSEISGVTITLRNSNKDVVITFPDSITLTTSSFLMIGNVDTTIYSPKDASLNPFKGDTAGTTVSLSGALPAVNGTGLSSATLRVLSPTLLEATFARDIETISTSEFKITNSANSDITPTSYEICTAKSTNCEEENSKKVIFTIPSGTSNEFTARDLTASLITRGTSALSSKDTLNLPIGYGKTLASSNTNNIKPVLKSAALSNANTLVLTFDGKIKAGEGIHLANDLIVTQTVSGTTTTLTGYGAAVTAGKLTIATIAADTTVVTVTLGTSLSTIDPITVRTVSADSITTLGANDAKIAANTTGIVNSSFVASAITEALPRVIETAGYGYGIDNGYGLSSITFNKNVDRASISGTWTDTGSGVYTMTGVAVTYDGSTNKINVSGVGEFEFTNLVVGTGLQSASGTAGLSLNTNTNVLTVTVSSQPSVATYYAYPSVITFTPASGIKTTLGTAIDTNFKPVVSAD